jgi:hypothetical protein
VVEEPEERHPKDGEGNEEGDPRSDVTTDQDGEEIMTRKALEAFDPSKLRPGHSASFEVRNKQTGYGEDHYFYRDRDGELFTMVGKHNACEQARKEWQRLKRAKIRDLVQLKLPPPFAN